MTSPLPLVAILCPVEFTFSEDAALVENSFLRDYAEVRTFRVAFNAPIPDAALAASVLILWHNIPVTAEVVGRLTNCRALIRNGVGYDSVDVPAATARGIPVCNVPDYGTEEVADHALALALALLRQLFPLDREAKKLGWKIEVSAKMRRARTLQFGIIGLGRIGLATALRAKAFGFRTVFFDPYAPVGMHKAAGLVRVGTLTELLRTSEILSVHCPLTAETRGMIGATEIAQMPAGAFLVNTARGDIVQKVPVLAALRTGHLGGAGLDVVEDEPLRTAEEADTPNLIVTCHAAFCSPEGMVEMRSTSAKIALAAVRGEPLWNRVNEN